jgi:hypothetical protein
MMIKLRITRGCLIAGRGCAEGALIDADARTANDLINEGRAELLDPREAPRLRDDVRTVYGHELAESERSARAGGWNVTMYARDPGPWRKVR